MVQSFTGSASDLVSGEKDLCVRSHTIYAGNFELRIKQRTDLRRDFRKSEDNIFQIFEGEKKFLREDVQL